MAKRVFMSSFLSGGVPDQSICSNGTDFVTNSLFLLVCNHGIAKNEKAYFEITINDYDKKSTVNYIPIYVGIHKEPASGTLNNDFCLGSIFYSTDTGFYSVMEKHLKTASTKNSNPGLAATRPPAVKEIIGVAIDRPNNTITIYREGIKLYEFKPSLFIMDDEPLFYPAVYSNLPANIKGYINFGANGCVHVPDGFTTVYRLHNKSSVTANLTGHLTVDNVAPTTLAEMSGETNVVGIKGNGDVNLVATSYDNFVTGTDFTLNSQNGSVCSSLPLANNRKIYTEFYVRDGILQTSQFGIPVTIGITDKPEDVYSGHTLRIPLHHTSTTMYNYFEDFDDQTQEFHIPDVDTSVPNEEGRYIGIGVDIPNRTVEIWVNKVHFYTYHITKFVPNNGCYLFIKSDGSFKNYVQGNVNFGADEILNPFYMQMPDGYMSLWYYYNKMNYYPVQNLPELVCYGFVVADKFTLLNKTMSGRLYVPDGHDGDVMHKPGLNKLMNTYNRVSNTADYYTKTFNILKPEDFNRIISSDSNGYYPNNPDDPDTGES